MVTLVADDRYELYNHFDADETFEMVKRFRQSALEMLDAEADAQRAAAGPNAPPPCVTVDDVAAVRARGHPVGPAPVLGQLWNRNKAYGYDPF